MGKTKQARDPPLDSERVLQMLADYADVRVVFLEHMVESSAPRTGRSAEDHRKLTTFV